MSASKPTIKTKSLEGLLMLFEVSENFEDESIDTIEGLLKNKNVKIMGLAYSALGSLISAYGTKKFKPQVFLPHIQNGCSSTNPAVKTEALKCFTAIYRWLGKATEGLLGDLKDILKK